MLVRFVTDNLVKNRLPESVVAKLCTQLTTMLYGKFNNHWHIRNPLIGSGYRAVQCTPKRVDKMLKQAFLASGAQLTDVSTFFAGRLDDVVRPRQRVRAPRRRRLDLVAQV